jgi:hypothetical protein
MKCALGISKKISNFSLTIICFGGQYTDKTTTDQSSTSIMAAYKKSLLKLSSL